MKCVLEWALLRQFGKADVTHADFSEVVLLTSLEDLAQTGQSISFLNSSFYWHVLKNLCSSAAL